MFRRKLFLLFIGLAVSGSIAGFFPSITAGVANASSPASFDAAGKQGEDSISRFDLGRWLVIDETSHWTPEELETLQRVMQHTFDALAQAGLDGNAVFAGYAFRRGQGEYANNRNTAYAVVNHANQEIVLSDSVLLKENEFFIYHELGHIVDRYSGRALNEQFHMLTLQVEGALALHDWTTVKGFYLRGQAHIDKPEATADAFALWVWVTAAGEEIPQFDDTPEHARPQAIVEVFTQAFNAAFAGE